MSDQDKIIAGKRAMALSAMLREAGRVGADCIIPDADSPRISFAEYVERELKADRIAFLKARLAEGPTQRMIEAGAAVITEEIIDGDSSASYGTTKSFNRMLSEWVAELEDGRT